MSDLRTDYPRRAKVLGGRVIHAIPQKGKTRIQNGIREIHTTAACGWKVNLTRQCDDLVDPSSPVSCKACTRALGGEA